MKIKHPFRQNLVLFLGILLASAAPGFSALKVEVLDTVKVHESRRYGYFPKVQMLSTGELICDFSLDADVHTLESNFWGYVISRDKGRTWGMRHTAGAFFREESAYTRDPALPDGSMLMVAGYLLPVKNEDYSRLHAASLRLSDAGTTALFRRDVTISLPQAAQRVTLEESKLPNFESLGGAKIKEAALMSFCGNLVAGRDGGWLATLYGKFVGDRYTRAIVARADSAGKQWECVSSITSDDLATAALAAERESATEGFGEPRMIRLADGRLFAVMRRGSNNQLYKSWSSDEGGTWTKPMSIGFRGVEPAVMQLRDGTLALATGRPDPIAVRFSLDGGATWTSPTGLTKGFERDDPKKPQGAQKSTCYTGLVEVEPGKLLIVYDHLPFVEGWGLNPADKPEAMNTIYGTFVKVNR